MPERKGTAPLTAREEPSTAQKTCMGCDAWEKFSCFNASSQFFGGAVDCGCRYYRPEGTNERKTEN